MHNPEYWGLLQFESGAPGSASICKNVEFPVRHALTQVYRAEREMMRLRGSYTEDLHELLNPAWCAIVAPFFLFARRITVNGDGQVQYGQPLEQLPGGGPGPRHRPAPGHVQHLRRGRRVLAALLRQRLLGRLPMCARLSLLSIWSLGLETQRVHRHRRRVLCGDGALSAAGDGLRDRWED